MQNCYCVLGGCQGVAVLVAKVFLVRGYFERLVTSSFHVYIKLWFLDMTQVSPSLKLIYLWKKYIYFYIY